MPPALVLTCEHAVDRLPRGLPRGLLHEKLRGTHWSHDIGALAVARAMARQLQAPLIAGNISRLLVDLNRSPHHPRVLSPSARALPQRTQEVLMERYHRAHWEAFAHALGTAGIARRQVLHVAVHSFTPVWQGTDGKTVRRTAEVGLLYDPARGHERTWAGKWLTTLHQVAPAWRVRRNYPYLGRADGLATATRKRWPHTRYIGFELEINQALMLRPSAVARILSESLRMLLERT